MAAERRRSLPTRIAEYLITAMPEKTRPLGREGVDELVRISFKRALSYGITIEWDLCRYCLFALVYGARFDLEQEWANEILTDEESKTGEKIAALESRYVNSLA